MVTVDIPQNEELDENKSWELTSEVSASCRDSITPLTSVFKHSSYETELENDPQPLSPSSVLSLIRIIGTGRIL